MHEALDDVVAQSHHAAAIFRTRASDYPTSAVFLVRPSQPRATTMQLRSSRSRVYPSPGPRNCPLNDGSRTPTTQGSLSVVSRCCFLIH